MKLRAIVLASLLVACVGCDHATKLAATRLLDPAETISLASGALRFELASNSGAFLSLGATLPEPLRALILRGLVPLGLVAAAVAVLRARGLGLGQTAAVGLVLGGGFANWLDRMLNDGAVTDFVSLGVGPLRTGVFNVADVAIVAGVLISVAGGLRSKARPAGDPP
jgi:signal peptidase II